jgi:ribosome-binding protein aMBF1 (putative translation factor)
MRINFYLMQLFFFILLFYSCQNSRLILKSEDNYFKTSLGEIIRKQRMIKGMTQEELAIAVNMSQNSLSLIEDGYATPILHKMEAFESILGIQLIEKN